MKYVFIVFIVLFFTACHDDEFASIDEMSYIVYPKEIKCKPVSTNNGFYAVTTEDSIPWLTYFDLTGQGKNLLDISTFFTNGLTIDSVDNINLSQNSNNNLIISFTYIDTSNNINVNAIEVSQQGIVTDEISRELSLSDTIGFSFNAIGKTVQDNWLIISSGQSQQGDNSHNKYSYIYLQINEVNGDSMINTSLQKYEGVSINNIYVLSNNSIAVSFSQGQSKEPGFDQNTVYLTRLTFIFSPDQISEIELDDSLTQIYVLKYSDNMIKLLGLGPSDEYNENSSLIFNEYNNNLEKTVSFKTMTESKFTPTCMHMVDEQIIVGGYSGDIREFTWTDIYSVNNTSTGLYSINTEGEIIWDMHKTSNFPELVLSITNNDAELILLYAKKTFNVYKTTTISKTSVNGNTN